MLRSRYGQSTRTANTKANGARDAEQETFWRSTRTVRTAASADTQRFIRSS